jgi:transposase
MQDKRRWLPSWQRVELAEKVVLEGWSCREAAAWRHVSISTVSEWARRRRAASVEEVRTGAWAQSRPSTPHHQPRLSGEEVHERVCEARSRTGWGPRLIASELGMAHATVSRCLKRRGLSRIPREPRGAVQRFEWPCPGDLLQMDTKRFARFSRPGTRSPGTATPLTPRSASALAMRSRTRSSTITHVWLTPSFTATRRPPPSSRSSTGRSSSTQHTESPLRACRQTTPGSTPTTGRSLSSSPRTRSRTAPSLHAPPSAMARWSATSRHSSGSGASASATAPQTHAQQRYRTG